MGTPSAGDGLELLNESRCDSLAAMILGDGQIVDVNFGARLFEFPELIGSKSADYRIVPQHGHGNETIAAKRLFEIRGAGLCALICVWFIECFAENQQEIPCYPGILRTELVN